jgi:hypothetical protein
VILGPLWTLRPFSGVKKEIGLRRSLVWPQLSQKKEQLGPNKKVFPLKEISDSKYFMLHIRESSGAIITSKAV